MQSRKSSRTTDAAVVREDFSLNTKGAAFGGVLRASPALMLKVLRRANKAPAVAKPTGKSLVCRGLCCCFSLFSSTPGFQKANLGESGGSGLHS